MKKTITTSNGKQQAVKFRKRQEEAVTGDIVNSIYSYWLESGASRGAPLFLFFVESDNLCIFAFAYFKTKSTKNIIDRTEGTS